MIVYRILRINPPNDSDYLTLRDIGRTIRHSTPELERMSTGYSVLINLDAARQHAHRRPWLGVGFIGVYELAEDADFTIKQTGVNLAHYILWCSADALRSCLTDVLPIEDEPRNV